MFDDGRGVNENLNEGGINGKGLVIRGHHFVLVDNFENSYNHRLLGELLMMRPLPMFAADTESPTKFMQNFNGKVTFLHYALMKKLITQTDINYVNT